MPSLIPGFEYDIFISYRQKDNKGAKWVSEFVESLKTELESTFKEDVSVFFDVNPHNGLLETHDVDASLKDKLKCLVFIPIISRTYCDPNSFAWEHEFKAFIDQASKDQFGLKVKLPGGNVMNRVLPVIIHDLDFEDKNLVEKEIGGFIRGIEFVYKEPGVNRPLKPDDDERINLNKTKYRNQINKASNAVKEIISGIKTKPSEIVIGDENQYKDAFKNIEKKDLLNENKKPVKLKWKGILEGTVIVALVLVAIGIIYPKFSKRNTLEELRSSGKRISVAVMPFQNLTNDPSMGIWQTIIQLNLISSLSEYSDQLIVFQKDNINNLIEGKNLSNLASITPSAAGMISKKLNADVFINGTINQVGKIIRINAALNDTRTEKQIYYFKVDGTYDSLLTSIDSLFRLMKNSLIVYNLGKNINPELQDLSLTDSPEALMYFIYGTDAFAKMDYVTAREMYFRSIKADSNYLFPYINLTFAYGNDGQYTEAKKWCLKINEKRDQMPQYLKLIADMTYARFFETPYEEIKCLEQYNLLVGEAPMMTWNIGNAYTRLSQYDKAISEYEKCLAICDKWEIKPFWVYFYTFLGSAYHAAGEFKKEERLYRQAEKDFPDNHFLIYRKAVLALSEGDTINGRENINKYILLQNKERISEADLKTSIAEIYSEAGNLDNAEKFYREAITLQPYDNNSLNNLAYFLIDKEINIKEGIMIADQVLEKSSESFDYLHTKGWGLYKLGMYSEAYELLKKSWELRPNYFQNLYDHLEAAKKAVASQKNN